MKRECIGASIEGGAGRVEVESGTRPLKRGRLAHSGEGASFLTSFSHRAPAGG
jgi:hypothetical protein